MISISESRATTPNEKFVEGTRNKGEDNVAWVARNLPADSDGITMLMVGGRDPMHFRLRVAQSHIRHDLTPSFWSHVMLLGSASKITTSTPVHEIALDPERGFGFPPETNAVQKGRLAAYKDIDKFPNIALIRLGVDSKMVMAALDRFRMQRSVLDALELTLRWLSYTWGVGRSGNPLLDGYGVPSAAMLEVVIGAAGYDLTPGLESRSSCPDAIWQAARWWHEYYTEMQDQTAPSGIWYADHFLL